jgi:acyl-[acyl-carrier-protein]-phospholipid O-acyltransferase / long-chain-fatty-acid--[acyl-carrier-protein] ligase
LNAERPKSGLTAPIIAHAHGPRHTTASLGFWAVCLVQFMTAFVDNAFRIGIIAFAVFIEVQAKDDANAYVWPAHQVATISTVLMLLPYALLSLAAGALSDRYPKRWVFIVGKFAELPLMAAGMIGLMWSYRAVMAGESPVVGIGLVLAMIFFLGVQVAFISPARYGILPEILDDESLTEGNGYLELCSFGGIFAGTLSAGFVVDGLREGSAFWWAPWLVPAATLIGIAASFFVPYTPPANPTRPIIEGFLPQRFLQNWRVLQSRPGLVTAVWGMVIFWSAGVAVTLNAANAGNKLLGLGSSPIDANSLVVAVSIGLGLGSLAAGRISRGGIELGLVPLGAIIWALSFAGLALTHVFGMTVGPNNRDVERLNPTLFLLFVNGFGAGMFVIPINAFVEHESPHEHRASCIATSNIVQVLGMIFMSLLVMKLIDVIPDAVVGVKVVWVVLGVLLAAVAIWVVRLFPDIFIRFVQSIFVRVFYRFRVLGEDNIPADGPALVVYNHLSYMDGTLAMAAVQRPTRFVVWTGHYKSKILERIGKASGAIPIDPKASPKELITALRRASEALERGDVVAVFAEGGIARTGVMLPFQRGLEVIAKRAPSAPIIPAYIDGMWGSIFSYSGGKFFWGWPSFKRRKVTVTFGPPLPNDTPAPVVRAKVRELGSQAWMKRRKSFVPLGRLFIKSAWKFGKRPCIADLNRDLKYGETLKAAVALSGVLKRHAGSDQYIGVLAPPSVGAAVTNIALAILGRTAVNLNYTIGDEVMNRCIDQCGIRIVFASRAFLDKVGLKPRGQIVYLEDLKEQVTKGDKLRAAAAWLLPPAVSTRTVLRSSNVAMDSLATIVFSSGSTGEPKGVMLTHFNLAANVQAGIEVIGVLKTDVLMGVLPFFHSFGYNVTMWLPFLVGAKVVYHYSPLEPDVVGGLIKKHGGTVFLSTATFMRGHLRKNDKEELATLRYIVCGAEKLPMQLADQFEKKFGIRPLEGYGCTELSPLVSCNRPDFIEGDTHQVLQKQGTIGHPLPGIAVKVVNADTFEELPNGEEGMLLVTGPNVMKGYLHKPDLTAQAIRDGWYVTGDVAKLDDDGFITITDRVSRFSKIGGEMVPHAKVEDLIHQTLSTNDRVCIVVGLPDERKGERLAVVHTKLSIPVDQLWNQLRENLPPLWVPAKAAFMEVPELPILGSGKLDLKGAKTLAANRKAAGGATTEPETQARE